MKNRVLICDDAAIMRLAIKDVLTRNGYEIVGEACNGREAVMLYDSLKPDLVFMDITMPEQDGVSALKEIKKTDPSARVIMCAAIGQSSLAAEAIQAGAADVIIKPVSGARLLETAKQALK